MIRLYGEDQWLIVEGNSFHSHIRVIGNGQSDSKECAQIYWLEGLIGMCTWCGDAVEMSDVHCVNQAELIGWRTSTSTFRLGQFESTIT
jgi:hypothetical protein